MINSTECLMIKALVKGYRRKSGVFVRPHTRKNRMRRHPQRGDDGKPVTIERPSTPSAPESWSDPDQVATFVPNGNAPNKLNGIAVTAWGDAPTTVAGWDFVDGINHDLDEPDMILPPGKRAAAGVIVVEKDGRVWLTSPTNQYGGYNNTFPKGTAEAGLSLQGNALKECFEESGLKVKIVGLLGDFERTTSVGRMYLAERVGGDPTDCGWETQAMQLVPKGMLYRYLNMYPDWGIAEKIGAGPVPLDLSNHAFKKS